MKLRYFVIAAATGLALSGTAGSARADGFGFGPGCSGPGCGGGGHTTLFGGLGGQGSRPLRNLFGNLTAQPKLPVFQAAPWYQYWPYDAHFLTPAPISGPFYGPPLTGNFPVNPYFPGPAGAYGYGAGHGFGHGFPGGPPPHPMGPHHTPGPMGPPPGK